MSWTLTKKPDDSLKTQAVGAGEEGGWEPDQFPDEPMHQRVFAKPSPPLLPKRSDTGQATRVSELVSAAVDCQRCPRSQGWGSKKREKCQDRLRAAQMPFFQAQHPLCHWVWLQGRPEASHEINTYLPRPLVAFYFTYLFMGTLRSPGVG